MEKRTKRILSLLAIPIILLVVLSGVALATNLIQIPQTGQTKCYDAQGIEIPCAGTGQDGDNPKGAIWPNPRFTDNNDGTLTDKLTGLVWLKDANCFGSLSWTGAIDKVADFNANPGSYACQDYVPASYDWRLPNINELNSLINANEPYPNEWLISQGFSNVQYDWYWSSTTNKAYPLSAWTMSMIVGWINGGQDKATGQLYVWPVAKGQSGTPDLNYPANVHQTGQKTVYYPGDDGSIQAGVKDPVGRFNDNPDGTVTDTLTGLIWMKDTSSPTVGTCSVGTSAWQEALDYAKCLNTNNYLSHTDWRVPNRAELHSLMDYSEFNPSLPLGHPFINLQTNLPNYRFWTSTTVTNPNYGNTVAWQGDVMSGALDGNWKETLDYPYLAWLVRGESGVVVPAPLTAKIISPLPDENRKRGKTIDDLVDVSFKGSAEGGKPGYTYIWYLDGSEIPEQGQDVIHKVSYGKHSLKLTVKDSVGTTVDSSVTNFEIATTIAIVPVKLGTDSYQSSDAEIRARMDDLKNYYYQQSYQKENVIADLKVGWDSAKKLTKTPDQYKDDYKDFCPNKNLPCWVQSKDRYLKQIVADATEGISLKQYNAAVVIFASDANSEDTFVPVACVSNSRYPELQGDVEACGETPYALIPENRMSNVWIHEVGHAAFDFTDKYGSGGDIGGNIGYWGIMGAASRSAENLLGTNPLSPVDMISKRDAHWISENPLEVGEDHPINLINDEGIYIFKPTGGGYSYIIEGRKPFDDVLYDGWCKTDDKTGNNLCVTDKYKIYPNPLKETKGVLLYQYDESVSYKAYSVWYVVDRIFDIKNNKNEEPQNMVTLKPNSPSETFDDPSTGIYFHVTEENGQLYLDILEPKIYKKEIYIAKTDIYLLSSFLGGYVSTQNIPDIDLKVYNSAGQMVGMNYTSEMYEVGIDGINTSGNMYGGMEWIAYPDDMDLYAVLDATPLKLWAEEVNVTLPENITVPMYMVLYDSNGTRIETEPVNITIDTANPVRVVQTSELLPDTTPPNVEFIMPQDGTKVLLNENTNILYKVTDESGIASTDTTTPNGTQLDTSSVGLKSITVNATDNAGNTASKTISYRVTYGNITILQPINENNSSVIKQGSVKPIKISIKDANGNNVTSAVAKINITWIGGTVSGSDIEDFSTGNANTDGIMRLTSEGIYIYHWGTTKDMKLGTYKIRIELDDGTIKEVLVGLRK